MADDSTSVPETKPQLTYEETPIIDPSSVAVVSQEDKESVVPEATQVFQTSPAPSSPTTSVPPQKQKGKNHIGTILFVILLFGLGIWLSTQLRSFFAPTLTQEVAVPTSIPTLLPTPNVNPLATPSGSITNAWLTYEVMSGVTKKAISGLSYQLPAEVKAPVCDSTSCASSGTNLPGGTRFTVAARGKGQLLPDFRGAILTDASGKEFVMKQGVFGGVYAYEYMGDFTGRTGGGYTFTKMRGVLMPVSETLAIEFNHFAPLGAASDFAKDDTLFDEIIKTFKFSISQTLPIATPTSAISTTSGF